MNNVHKKNLFYMKLEAKHLIPSSTIQIVEEINVLHDICSQHTKKQFKEILRARTNLPDFDVEAALSTLADLHSSCSHPLSLHNIPGIIFFQKNFSYVHPQPIHLGTDENRRDHYVQRGQLRITRRQCSYYKTGRYLKLWICLFFSQERVQCLQQLSWCQ